MGHSWNLLRFSGLFLLIAAQALPCELPAQGVGDRVRLESSNPAGVPVHPDAGDPAYFRWANGTIGFVTAIDSATTWRQVVSHADTGWVVVRYLTVVAPEPTEPEEGAELLSYVVGAWNIEWLHNSRDRGFPEYNQGGRRYGPREDEDYEALARFITDRLFAKILVLSEINGTAGGRSNELDRLLGVLGADWAYQLALSGGQQRVAILYDSSAARRGTCIEIQVERIEIQNADVFSRDPLLCHFTLLDRNRQPRNDLVVVGLHLASGQRLVQNHDQAMEILRGRLAAMFADGTLPSGERDVLIAGDLNASRYDNHAENFWEGYDPQGFQFRTLSPADGEEYAGTRLAGVPLYPSSKIDYILASGVAGGLLDELVQSVAHVHVDLLPSDFNEFRARLSDHIPVTVRVRVGPDTDP